ncbi:MAG TPA: hypothetical protein PKE12_10270 [Kiritimatiellia bacterium]|nr:hypothetical protein [Kiritimatiellia bacterium]
MAGCRIRVYSCSFVFALLLSYPASAGEVSLQLARELSAERDHAGAAVEFRRLALSTGVPAERAAYHWSAAFEQWRAGDSVRADALLDRAEDEHALASEQVAALRGELALTRRQPTEAVFHFEAAARVTNDSARLFALRKQSAAALRAKDHSAARRAAVLAGPDAELAVLDYVKGRDKNPALGGWLGTVPGLGYAYAGEYANAARSIILNGLFIWGMVETADDKNWGAFAVITFFEITWYSGSIYGGIDASHRHNQRRLARAEAALTAGYSLQPDYEALPALQLRYRW